MILFTHPTGNANVRAALDAFYEADLLGRFMTTVATFDGSFYAWLARAAVGSEFERRRYRQELAALTRQRPLREILRLVSSKAKLTRLVRHETGPFCIDEVYQDHDRCVARHLEHKAAIQGYSAVYAYEDGALACFRSAKKHGLHCLYDLPIGYWRAARGIQSEECELLPEWASTMPALIDSDAKVARKVEELQMADQIFVASSFTAMTLKEAPFELPQPVVIPYGCPETGRKQEAGGRRQEAVSEGNDPSDLTPQASGLPPPLRVLFVGGLSQRKGLSYLFDAVASLGSSVELTVIGRKPAAECRPLEAALQGCRWIESLPHEKILEEMQRQDVFVFPSLFEGFGLVVTEALSQGIPVITTPNTCGPDILTDGEDGFIVPIRDSQAIAEKLEVLHRDRERLAAMREAAVETAKRLTWEAYRHALVRAVTKS